MDRFRNFGQLAAIVGVLVGAVILAGPLVCLGAVKVKVANDLSDPVPMVMTNPSSNPVPMVLTNLFSNPVPILNSDNPALQPVAAEIFFVFSPVPRYPVYTVPAGKRLVIEFVSHRTQVDSGDLPDLQLIVKTAGSNHFISLPVSKTATVSGSDYYSGGHPVRIYVDPGEVVTLQVEHIFAQMAGPSGLFSLSGSLVDLP